MARQTRGNNGAGKKEYDNTNRTSMWATEQFIDGSNAKAPIFRGTLDVNGVPHNISFWLNQDLKDFEEDLAALLGEMVDELGKKPILRGNIQPAEDKGSSGGSRRGTSNTTTRGKGRSKATEDEERDEDDSWA